AAASALRECVPARSEKAHGFRLLHKVPNVIFNGPERLLALCPAWNQCSHGPGDNQSCGEAEMRHDGFSQDRVKETLSPNGDAVKGGTCAWMWRHKSQCGAGVAKRSR